MLDVKTPRRRVNALSWHVSRVGRGNLAALERDSLERGDAI
jgi:hypothetical protein